MSSQESNAPIVIAADVSRSTRCGARGEPIARVIARAVATFAMAAAFSQDRAELLTFDRDTRCIAVRPRVGKNHAIHCIEAYDVETGRTRIISSADLEQLGSRVREWQDTAEHAAHDHGLEVLRLGGSSQQVSRDSCGLSAGAQAVEKIASPSA